jgi:hypothetical protein
MRHREKVHIGFVLIKPTKQFQFLMISLKMKTGGVILLRSILFGMISYITFRYGLKMTQRTAEDRSTPQKIAAL